MADGGLLAATPGGLPVDPSADCADLLTDLAAGDATGCLLIVHPSGEASEVYLKDGLVYSVFVPGRRPMLGSRLMSSGELAPEALAEALEIQRTELQGWRLGELLVHLGYVDRGVVESFVTEQLLDMATDLLGAAVSSHRFRAKKLTRQDVAPPIAVPELLAAAGERRAEWGQITTAVGGALGVPRLATTAPAANDVVLGPGDWAMLCKVDGARTLAELAEDCGLTLHEAGRLVASLTSAGLVEVDVPELDDAPETADGVEDAALAEAFAQVADAWSGPSRGEEAAEAEASRREAEHAAAEAQRQAEEQYEADAAAAAEQAEAARRAADADRRKAEAQELARELEAAAAQARKAQTEHAERARLEAEEQARREAEEQARLEAERAAAEEARRADERRRATAAVVRWLAAELAQGEIEDEARTEAAWREQAAWYGGILEARREAERIEAERVAAEAEAARLEAERVEAERIEAERVDAERPRPSALEAERVAAEPKPRPPASKPSGSKPSGSRPSGSRPSAIEAERAARPSASRPSASRPSGSRPSASRPSGSRPRRRRRGRGRPPRSRADRSRTGRSRTGRSRARRRRAAGRRRGGRGRPPPSRAHRSRTDRRPKRGRAARRGVGGRPARIRAGRRRARSSPACRGGGSRRGRGGPAGDRAARGGAAGRR